jgi:outer membrane murein-binding lipoprotein Lpp
MGPERQEPMADDKSKKPKIDLKARLGKTMTGMSSPSAVPLPVPGVATPSGPPAPDSGPGAVAGAPSATPSAPAPPPRPSGAGIAPPLGIVPLSPGIPVPPFARPAAAAPPPAQSKPTAAQQTIKVEIGEEIHEERKKASKRALVVGVLALVLGVGVGWPIGGAQERSGRSQAAIVGAQGLEKDVKAANEKIKALDEKLAAAAEKLGNKDFPADVAKELGAINVPFDASNLEGKQVGSLPGKVLRQLLAFTTSVQDLNSTKESLKNLMGAVQPVMEKAWKEEKEPVVNFSVLLRPEGQKGFVAELVPNKEAFKFGGDWPAKLTVLKSERGKQVEKPADRYVKGDIKDIVALPVDPPSVAAFTSQELVGKLIKALRDTRQIMEGNQEDPTHPEPGLMKTGEDLATQLHQVAIAR